MISKHRRVQGLVLISRCFLGHKESQEATPHSLAHTHTHPAALPSLPCLPTCASSRADIHGAADRRPSKESPESWAAHRTQQPKSPGLAVRCKPSPWHQAIYCCGLDAVERSKSYLRGHPAPTASVLSPESALPAEDGAQTLAKGSSLCHLLGHFLVPNSGHGPHL